MIYSSIHVNEDLGKYPQALQRAISWLKTTDFSTMKAGTYEIEGKQIYAMVQDATSRKKEAANSEFHLNYIDVQFIISGEELMGYCPKKEQEYEIISSVPENDVYFVSDPEKEQFFHLTEGDYMVLFPTDFHRPSICITEPASYRKVVLKVAMSAI